MNLRGTDIVWVLAKYLDHPTQLVTESFRTVGCRRSHDTFHQLSSTIGGYVGLSLLYGLHNVRLRCTQNLVDFLPIDVML